MNGQNRINGNSRPKGEEAIERSVYCTNCSSSFQQISGPKIKGVFADYYNEQTYCGNNKCFCFNKVMNDSKMRICNNYNEIDFELNDEFDDDYQQNLYCGYKGHKVSEYDCANCDLIEEINECARTKGDD